MAKFDDRNRGVLFKNHEKEDPQHADYKGNANVGGAEYWLDAWLNTSKAGVKYMKLSFKPKTEKVEAKASAGIDYSDEIPFAPERR